MNRRQLTFAGILALTLLLTFMLRDAVETLVIIPLAYLWWLLKLYYSLLPQVVFWALLVALALYSAITNLIPETESRATLKHQTEAARGQVEILADWIEKSKRGTYYKWLIANRLGKNAGEILAQREGHPISKKIGALAGHGWDPPQEINSYLENGLNGSFADFPHPRWSWQNPPPTPLDINPQQVMDYLEDEMETTDGRDQKSI